MNLVFLIDLFYRLAFIHAAHHLPGPQVLRRPQALRLQANLAPTADYHVHSNILLLRPHLPVLVLQCQIYAVPGRIDPLMSQFPPQPTPQTDFPPQPSGTTSQLPPTDIPGYENVGLNEKVIVAVYACGVDVEKGPIRQQLWNAPPCDNVESWFGAQSRMIPAGDPVDSPQNGPAPGPWDIQLHPSPPHFEETSTEVPVPHTDIVKQCPRSDVLPVVAADELALRTEHVAAAGDLGIKVIVAVYACGVDVEKGPIRQQLWNAPPCDNVESCCLRCSSRGKVQCDHCDGRGQVKSFIQLAVNWVNHVEECFTESPTVPNKHIVEVRGSVAFNEQNFRVAPLTNFPDEAVNSSSRFLLEKHANLYNGEYFLQQRHKVQVVPITEVNYTWGEQNGKFHVYGLENKVYFPNYPRKFCCCTII
ncbi:hypothetical protein LAZ67_3004236 [Cordylochernes scorpioides]|uniref:Uncharacterized protein n=1 Tax=Cordylochernes scorpioides TaxID=51811 RepID=A0ABY6KDU9_9ARAC|nr:hypothetical protein LAZ67_3004236 [Cordylochernes scorpioides]